LLRAQRGRRSPGRAPPSSALRYSTLYGDLKAYLAQRAGDLGASDPVASAKFRQASTHWLRHTCATLALRSGVPINAVQRVLGHASLQTTSHYLTEQQDALQTAMEGFAAAQPAGMKR
jgi:integrase